MISKYNLKGFDILIHYYLTLYCVYQYLYSFIFVSILIEILWFYAVDINDEECKHCTLDIRLSSLCCPNNDHISRLTMWDQSYSIKVDKITLVRPFTNTLFQWIFPALWLSSTWPARKLKGASSRCKNERKIKWHKSFSAKWVWKI